MKRVYDLVESNLNDLYNLAREGGEYLKKGKCKKEAAYSVEIITSVITAYMQMSCFRGKR